MENLINFVPEQLLVLVAALNVLGIFLKNTPAIKDWVIPYILLTVGIAASSFLVGFNATGILQGVVCTGVAVLTNQLFKQTTKNRGE